ncbi:MAG: reverse transcriptase domain-containing protein [Gammaproteobacteria bacterium]|nr:reverse transcriptase domain-containing protein [Gammaproteobacteria bacterium]
MTRLVSVREVAKWKEAQPFTAIYHHMTLELFTQSFIKLSRKAAPGIDLVDWNTFNEHREEHLIELHRKLRQGQYRPKPTRRVFIAKEDGTKRPLSIQCLADKIVQMAVVALLNEIYEVDFLGFSYGFQPKRSQYDALDALAYGIGNRSVNWVLDLYIEKFFDTVEHDWLIRMVQQRVKDKRIVSLIRRWIKVGVVNSEGKRNPATCGVPQGAVISPLLAYIYLHHVFDLWINQWRQKYADGDVIIIRYADDALLSFKSYAEAVRCRNALQQRLAKFGLKVHPKKT